MIKLKGTKIMMKDEMTKVDEEEDAFLIHISFHSSNNKSKICKYCAEHGAAKEREKIAEELIEIYNNSNHVRFSENIGQFIRDLQEKK